MKLSEIKGEKALEVLADLIDPATAIMADAEVKKAYDMNKNVLQLAKVILKRHPKEVVAILAALDGVPVEDYEVNIVSLPKKLLEILNDEELQQLFS